ncbi:MAG: SprB repeat-containing protein [Flavobacteriales bacterium]|nr:SprB repeat-containing protein [Flavobacteriales bacterium]
MCQPRHGASHPASNARLIFSTSTQPVPMRIVLLALVLLVHGAARAVDVYTSVVSHPFCGYINGIIEVTVSGGTPPYTYAWNNGAIGPDLTGLGPGSYTVTVTDADAATDELTVVLVNQSSNPNTLATSYIIDLVGYHPCPGQCNGRLRAAVEFLNGVAPYGVYAQVGSDFVPQLGVDQNGSPYFGPFCHGDQVQLTYTDANGCGGTGATVILGPELVEAVTLGVNGACNGANGSAAVQVPNEGWPTDLSVVDISDQSVVYTDQLMGDALIEPNGLPAGMYQVRQTWSAATPGCSLVTGGFIVPDAGADCGLVGGSVWLDVDEDCALSAGDVDLLSRLLHIGPGENYAITDGGGYYAVSLPYGAYSVAAVDAEITPTCPPIAPALFTIDAAAPYPVVDLAMGSTEGFDLEVQGASGPARPGFNYALSCYVNDLTIQPSGPVTLTLVLDPVLTYVQALPVPTSVNGNTLTWSFPNIASFGVAPVQVGTTVPADVALIGTVLNSTATVTAVQAEPDVSNNSVTIQRTVTGSYDPNDKLVEPADVFLLDVDTYLDYTIRFQNTGTDTAFTVVVVDTLAAELGIGSLQVGAASHAFVPELEGRVLRFRFTDILLPDSTTNEAASHGHVSFRIKPTAGVVPGTWLRNQAGIYFDFNPPIVTPVAEVVTGISTAVRAHATTTWSLVPNPATDRVLLRAPQASAAPVLVTCIAADGRAVLHERLAADGALDLRKLPPGTYALHVMQGTTRDVLRLVVAR